ncbi:MAG TPA: cytochrome C [Actinobacteria bacterium]|nr:cytochrome C [Actinomycetota bacterium]
MASTLDRILGPRVPPEERAAHADTYRKPALFFGAAALLLMASMLLPYWILHLEAPQFPDGLTVQAYVNRLEGDVEILEGLNHYVGLPSFEHGAVLERTVSIAAITVLAGLLLAAFFIHSRWVVLLALPALLFPLIFLADLQYWLWKYGHSLDPRAPLADAVGEFTPPIFGPARIAQFHTLALPGPGLLLAFVASGLVAAGLWYHRKAFKPLIEQMDAEAEAASR